MKNRKINFCLLAVLLFPLVCFAADKTVSPKSKSFDSDYFEVGAVEKRDYSDMDVESILSEAKDFYFDLKLEDAEEAADTVLDSDPKNSTAIALKNKISKIREKYVLFLRELTDGYLIELNSCAKLGNFYEGFMYYQKIEQLVPEAVDKFAYIKLSEQRDKVADKIDNINSKQKFLDSVNYFRDGKYTKASKIVNSLSKKDSKFNNYAAMVSIYTLKERSAKRAASNYKQALKYVKSEKFNDALDYAQMAYGLVQDDVKIKILIEQINLEIELDN
jgi:tetratricopeptide (TPR) repeat protein